MIRRAVILLVALALAACGGDDGPALEETAEASADATTSTTLGPPVGSFAAASWSVECDSVKVGPIVLNRAPIDPIVSSGLVGATHMHDFLNAPGVNENTDLASLMAAPAPKCNVVGDRSSYWYPTLYNANDVPLEPKKASIYYVLGNGKRPGNVVPLPQGLKIVAGNSGATAAQKQFITSWGCVSKGGEGGTNQATIPRCAAGDLTVLNVRWPQCWDGVNLDVDDHKSHMKYLNNEGLCPEGWARVPQTTLAGRYDLGGQSVTGFHLASGGQYSGHADLFVAWDPGVQENLVATCINDPHKCRFP